MINSLKNSYHYFNTLLYPPGISIEDKGRRRLFIIFLIALMPPMIIFGTTQFQSGSYIDGIIDYLMPLVFFAFIFMLRYSKTGRVLYRIVIVLIAILLLRWVQNATMQGYPSIWVLTFPPFALFLTGRKEGTFWSIILGVATAIIFIDPSSNLTSFNYSTEYISRHLVALLIIFCFAYNYEWVREQFRDAMESEQHKLMLEKDLLAKAKNEVDEINTKLNIEIKVRKRVEDELKKHYDHLEDLVAIRTRQLRKNNEELEANERRYQILADNVNDVIWVTDTKLNFTYISPSVSRIFGYTVEEAMNVKLDRWHPPESSQKILNAYKTKIKLERQEKADPERVLSVELEQFKKDGTLFYVEIKSSLARDNNGQFVGFVGVTRDVSERVKSQREKEKIQERLAQAQKMEAIGQLAGGAAHDLNNVLGALSGYSELLMMNIPENQQARGYIENILQSTQKGSAIIQDLLTLTRRGVTASAVINLNSIVLDFLKTPVFEKIKDNHPAVTFRTECRDALLNIKGSTVHLEKALMNLVLNAVESMPGKGEVTIRTRSLYLDKPIKGYDEVEEGDYTVLAVSDSGTGIPVEDIEKIFEPFYTKKTPGRSGTGLGLAIVWGTVKDHHGYIDIQTKVGEGSTFTLYFPITREEVTAPQQKVPMEHYMGRGESVLVVDDIAEQREVASGLLKQLGYKVHVVASGEEAVEYLKSCKADILVLDMIMTPGIDGLETYQKVLEVNTPQKAILVSGFSETDRVRKAQKLGAGAYVKKPYVMEKIGVAIRDELNR